MIAGGKVTTTITTKDTGERKQMFGFTAKHLIITMETVGAGTRYGFTAPCGGASCANVAITSSMQRLSTGRKRL